MIGLQVVEGEARGKWAEGLAHIPLHTLNGFKAKPGINQPMTRSTDLLKQGFEGMGSSLSYGG